MFVKHLSLFVEGLDHVAEFFFHLRNIDHFPCSYVARSYGYRIVKTCSFTVTDRFYRFSFVDRKLYGSQSMTLEMWSKWLARSTVAVMPRRRHNAFKIRPANEGWRNISISLIGLKKGEQRRTLVRTPVLDSYGW